MSHDDDIPQLINRLEPNLIAPDPAVIREAARRHKQSRQGKLGAAGLVATLVVFLGAGLWLSGSQDDTMIDTAPFDDASDSREPAPIEFGSDAFERLRDAGAQRVTSNDPPPAQLETLSHFALDEISGREMPYVLWVSNGCDESRFLADWTADSLVIGPEIQRATNAAGDVGVRVGGTTNHFRAAGLACAPTSFPRVIDSRFEEGAVFTVGVQSRSTFVLSAETLGPWTITAQRARSVEFTEPEPIDDDSVENGAVDANSDVIWELADTRIGGDSSPTVHAIEGGVLILNTENRGGDVIGEIWDSETQVARSIGDTGLIWRHRPSTVWTGEELIMVGGSNGPGIDRIAVAYNPATDSWRDLAPPPSVSDAFGLFGGSAFWTGSEMVVPQESVAYDPAEDSWVEIAEWPFPDRQIAFVEAIEGGVIAWGGCVGPLCDETNAGASKSGAMYEFESNTWKSMKDGPLPPTVHAVATWVGTELVVVVTTSEVGVATAAFNPSTNSWRSLPDPPISARRASAITLNDDRLILWGGQTAELETLTDGVILNLFEEDWLELPDAPSAGIHHTMIDLGPSLYVSGSFQLRPQVMQLPPSRDLQYEECAVERGFDPGGVQVVFMRGRAQFVKTGLDVPAEVHLPCLEQIGGPTTVSGSSHDGEIDPRHPDE
jgi:hypothetical protein